MRKLVLAFVPLVVLGACAGLSDEDRAMLNAAREDAAQAKQQAAQALTMAQTAQADAKAANEKADRMFNRSLRK